MLGSAAWDILRPYDENVPLDVVDHIEACRQLLQRIQKDYPTVDIYWKLPNAMHVQVLIPKCFIGGGGRTKCVERTKYMTNTYIKLLYDKQKQLVEEEFYDSVQIIDPYLSTYLSPSWLLHGDGMHYRRWLNEHILNYYY